VETGSHFVSSGGTLGGEIRVVRPPVTAFIRGAFMAVPAEAAQQIRCKTCDVGTLERKKKYRMSGIVVAIGYIFLVPSVLGMLFSVLMLFATGKATTDTASGIYDGAKTRLRDAGISEPIVQKVVLSQPLTDAEKASLTQEQTSRVESVQSSITAGTVGAGAGAVIAGGVSVFFGIMSLVGGLLGWVLVMKKKVLQCNKCGAVIAAS
jgi:hypothetical protein